MCELFYALLKKKKIDLNIVTTTDNSNAGHQAIFKTSIPDDEHIKASRPDEHCCGNLATFFFYISIVALRTVPHSVNLPYHLESAKNTIEVPLLVLYLR